MGLIRKELSTYFPCVGFRLDAAACKGEKRINNFDIRCISGVTGIEKCVVLVHCNEGGCDMPRKSGDHGRKGVGDAGERFTAVAADRPSALCVERRQATLARHLIV